MLETHRHGKILELVISHPPVNALSTAIRQGLDDAVAAAQEDESIAAIVIRGVKSFSGGADITEFNDITALGAAKVIAPLPMVIEALEASVKPIVAAITGVALGGGLELALASHYRIATPNARLGLPEVKLGILPGAGGTQRLPRLVGVAKALDMIVHGDPISAQQALEAGLVDRLVEETALAEAAIAYAGEIAAQGPRRTGSLPLAPDPDVIARFEAAEAPRLARLEAARSCVQAVRAATELALSEGLELERRLFLELLRSEQSAALRHIFFAERAAPRIEGLARDIPLRPIGRVGIIGAGTMGGGIAMNFLSAGIPVTLVETAPEALERGVSAIRRNYERSSAKGKLSKSQVEQAVALLSPSLSLEDVAKCDLIIEAVFEDLSVKKSVFASLDAIARPGAILASNTSYLDIDEIAQATSRPVDVVGLHFFSPANIMKLVEVVRGEQTAPDVLATMMDLARRLRKIAVVSGVCFGFIGNRMLIPRQDQAGALLLEGATPQQIDKVHTDFGMPMGPFQMADLAGVDIGWHRDVDRVETIRDALCATGRLGQKTSAGFYDYDDRRRPTPSPVTSEIIDRFRDRGGVVPRDISEEEIIVRTLFTMVNEAAKILEEGIAQRASDIDVVYAFGYGWPTWRGGPMWWCDTIGAATIVAALDRETERLGPGFTVSPLLRSKAAAGASFVR